MPVSTVMLAGHRGAGRRSQRGLSLVEMMVGVAIGLFIVAAAATLVSGQLTDNRRLLIETQMQQDLRASMDIMIRQLRRAGGVGNGADTIMAPRDGSTGAAAAGRKIFCPAGSECAAVTPATSPGPDDQINFRFVLNTSESGPFGFKLEDGIIKTRSGSGGWQELTDTNVLNVTRLAFTTNTEGSVTLTCPKLCPGTPENTACWPKLEVRTVAIEIEAQSRSDTTVSRKINGTVRIRNDHVLFTDAANPSQICPV
jgi:type IV pilus assembly protein PilW